MTMTPSPDKTERAGHTKCAICSVPCGVSDNDATFWYGKAFCSNCMEHLKRLNAPKRPEGYVAHLMRLRANVTRTVPPCRSDSLCEEMVALIDAAIQNATQTP